jgi:hypothetical protein
VRYPIGEIPQSLIQLLVHAQRSGFAHPGDAEVTDTHCDGKGSITDAQINAFGAETARDLSHDRFYAPGARPGFHQQPPRIQCCNGHRLQRRPTADRLFAQTARRIHGSRSAPAV